MLNNINLRATFMLTW